MGSVYEEISRLETAKSDIEAAIENCGVNVPNTALLDTYSTYIRQIPAAVFSGLNADVAGGTDQFIQSIKQTNGLIETTVGGLVSASASGLAPKIGTAAAATIATQADEWVLTSTKGELPTWRKLPSNAFSNSNTVPAAHCTTAAGTAAKTATYTYYTATANRYVYVTFRYANSSAGAITLNINSTGAKPIYINGVASSASNYTLPAGAYLAYYDGSNYHVRTDGVLPGEIQKSGSSAKVANDLVVKIKSGSTEGTDLYTFNGSAAKTLDIKQGTGIGLTTAAGALTISNSGVRSVATGDNNGTIKVNTNGTSANVAVKGLGSAAYTASTDYAVRKALTNEDLNNVVTPGFYNSGGGNTVTNKPEGVEHFGLEVVHGASGSYYVQILFEESQSNVVWRRHCQNGAWSAWTKDAYTDTHYTTHLYVGAKSSNNSNASNAATTNGNTYLKLFDNSTLRHQYNIKGTGNTTVTSDSSGTITINSPTTLPWGSITDKPETFAPSAHNHNDLYYGKADVYTKTETNTELAKKLDKLTYEFNKELALGGSGKVCIGKFPMYDSNITVHINSTTNTTYHGTLVIATQNINTTGGGTYTATVYGDASNTLTDSIKIKYVSGSKNFEVYINLPGWSKNSLHIKCVALAGAPTNIAEQVDAIPSDATIVPTNALTNKFVLKTSANDHNHATSAINALTGYTKATAAANLAATDTLNTALGKLEYKAHYAYDWVISVTATDTDKYINKWGEIVDFLDSVEEGTDITDEFVTRKTAQTVTGLKSFQAASTSSALTGVALKLTNSGWTGSMSTAVDFYNGRSYTVPNARIETKMVGSGSAGGTLIFYTQTKQDTNPNPTELVERLRIDDNGTTKVTGAFTTTGNITGNKIIKSGGTSSQFLKADGSVDSNTYLTSHQSLANYVTLNGDQTITGKKTFSSQQSFTVAQGTSPFTVTSTTAVTNLNADLLDGVHASGLLTALANVDNTTNPKSIYVTVGGTTKYLKVNHAVNSQVLQSVRYDSDDPTPKTTVGVTFQFSQLPHGWSNVLTMKSYSDNNYTTAQLCTPATNPGKDTGYSGDMRWRQGRNETWSAWKIVVDSTNYTSYTPILNSASTHATSTSVIYAPTTAGTSGYILTSSGSGAPTWSNPANISIGTATNGVFYVEGTSTTAGTWTGSHTGITSYYTGLTIAYKINVAGADTTTLNINNFGAKTVKRNDGNLTTHVPVNSVIILVYDGTYFRWSDYDANSYAYVRQYKTNSDNTDYPLLFRYETSDPSSYVTKYTRYDSAITVNPSTNTITASGFIKSGSNDNYVLLGAGGHKAISDFLLKTELPAEELKSNVTTITKELTVTQDWMDVGIAGNNLPANGTYIVQVSVAANDSTNGNMWNCLWSGVMSWHKDGTNDTDSDEILLHRSGHAYGNTLYLRTVMRSSSTLKLQIAANTNIGKAYTYTFKFKQIL